jgi:hypothetical protein
MKSPDGGTIRAFLLMRMLLAQHIAALGILVEDDWNVRVFHRHTTIIG